MTLPSFFIIGAMKAGTTSLYAYLDEHPEIYMSRIKEPGFFGRPEDAPYRSSELRVGSRDEYERLFETTVRVRGEASPIYSLYPRYREVPQRIADLAPNAKFIYLVRNPIDRIVSHYMHNVAEDGLRQIFSQAVGDLSDRENPYVYPTLYATQLERYLEAFDMQHVLVIDQAELLTQRAATLRLIFSFLEVDRHYYSPRFEEESGSSRDRRRLPHAYVRLAKRVSRSPVRVWLPRGARRSGRRMVERALGRALEKPVVTDEHRRQLSQSCAEEVARLRQHTGIPFATWDM